jgi:hypothetical protein
VDKVVFFGALIPIEIKIAGEMLNSIGMAVILSIFPVKWALFICLTTLSKKPLSRFFRPAEGWHWDTILQMTAHGATD